MPPRSSQLAERPRPTLCVESLTIETTNQPLDVPGESELSVCIVEPQASGSPIHSLANPLTHTKLPSRNHEVYSEGRSKKHDPMLAIYLKEISKYDLLTRDQEVELVKRKNGGDDEALHKLINSNLRFVVSVAKKFYSPQGDLTLLDLINEGNLGLHRAATRFDETRGFKFISYAVWWIRQSIQKALKDNPDPLRIPENTHDDRRHLDMAREKAQGKSARIPNNDEVRLQLFEDALEALNKKLAKRGIPLTTDAATTLCAQVEKKWSDKGIESIELLAHPSKTESMDDIGDASDPDRPLSEVIASESSLPDLGAIYQSLDESLQKAFKRLTQREIQVVTLYYGLGQDEGMSLEKVGAVVHLTRERVRQIRDKALKKLRRLPSGSRNEWRDNLDGGLDLDPSE